MSEEAPPPKRARLDFSEHLTVLVGEEKKDFVVHKDLLLRRSPFFQAAVAKRWNDSGEPAKSIELPVDKPEVFGDYLHCLYLGKMPTQGSGIGIMKAAKVVLHIIDLYAFADKVGDTQTTNLVIDYILLVNKVEQWVSAIECAQHVFENTAPGSPLRRLFVNLYIHNMHLKEHELSRFENATEPGLVQFVGALLREFARVKRDVPQALVRFAFGYSTTTRPKCHYHQHKETCPPCDGVVEQTV